MIEVTAAIIVSEEKVLIAQKESTHKLAGLWEFPGGKIEINETPQQCLERELLEELGVSVEIGQLFDENVFKVENIELHLQAYVVRIVGGSLVLHEHDDALWVYPSELAQFHFVPSDQYFVNKLMTDGVSV